MSCGSLLRDCAQICSDCHSATSNALGLRGLTASGCNQLAREIALKLVACTSDSLCLRHPSKHVWRMLRECFVACTAWLFPAHMKWKRSNKHVELVWAASCVCRSILWLSANRHSRWAKKAGSLLEPRHREAIWRECRPKHWTCAEVRSHVDSLLGMQLLAIFPGVDTDSLFGLRRDACAGLYTWVSTRGYYVGIAHALRASAPSCSGVAARWLEHLALTLRPHCRDSGKLRYKLMRGLRPDQMFFLLCRTGDWQRVSFLEQLEIKSRRPNANVRLSQTTCSVACKRPRGRPPKFARKQCASTESGPFDFCDGGTRREVKQVCAVPAVATDFRSLYVERIKLNYVVHGVSGPLDIYAPDKGQLLAVWSGSKGAVIDWQLLERKWRTGCGPAALARFVPQLVGKGRKTMATKRINAELQARLLPTVRGVTCHVPRESMLPVFRSTVKSLVFRSARHWNLDERKWLCSRVRLVPGVMPKFRDAWNAPMVCKDQGTDAAKLTDSCCRPQALTLVSKVWDVPRRPSVAEDAASASAAGKELCAQLHLGVPEVGLFSGMLALDATYQRERRFFSATACDYHRYTSDMVFDPTSEVLAPDDKQKKFMWLMPRVVYLWFLWFFATLAPAWRLTQLSVADANSWCYSVLDCLLTDRLKVFLAFRRYTRVVPYCYATVKSKCFRARQWVCKKASHSCFRKVVSFATWPARKRWRFVHRALETVMKEVGGGDEVWSLGEACRTMRSRLQTAGVRAHSGHTTCARCCCRKPSVVILTADAGQFFEAVSPGYASRVVRACLVRALRVKRKEVVTVLRNRKRSSFIGGTLAGSNSSSYRFSFDELFLAFVAAMMVNLCSVGSAIFHMSGLPIGGVLSKIAASFVLGHEEFEWECNVARRAAAGFTATTSSWNREVARARYVDDLLWASRVYCRACLVDAIRLTYSVTFDIQDDCSLIKWLDLQLCSVTLQWRMAPKSWALAPAWAVSPCYLRSFFGGRFHRWAEVPLCDEAWLDALVEVLLDLKLVGWPRSVVRAAAFQAWRSQDQRRKHLLLRGLKSTWRS